MNQARISAKTLGQLALPTFCERCFWLQTKLEHHTPWTIFPGIFASIDSFSKKITNIYSDKHDVVPPWLKGFGDLARPVPVPHHSSFYIDDAETGIRLSGTPDEILRMTNGFFFIADYKTAKFTAHADSLLGMYQVQLNAYAYIGERRDFKPVRGIGLVYYEPQTDLSEEWLDSVVMADGFRMPFTAKLLPLKLEPGRIIPPLLRKARQILDLDEPPKGRDGCKDCQRVDALVDLLTRRA